MPVRILIVDDNALIREGLRFMLDGDPGLEVVGEAGGGQEAIEQAGRLRPDVVLMDYQLPDIKGLEATRRITAGDKHVRVVSLSMHSDAELEREMFQAGACAVVLKDSGTQEIIRAISEVMRGERYVDPRVTIPD